MHEHVIGSGNSPSNSMKLGGSGSRETVSQVAVCHSDQLGVQDIGLNKPMVPCLTNWMAFPEPMANQTPLDLCYAVNQAMNSIEDMIQ